MSVEFQHQEIRIDNWNTVPERPRRKATNCIHSIRKNTILSFETKAELMEKLKKDPTTENLNQLAKEYRTKVNSLRAWQSKLNKGESLERKSKTSRKYALYMELADWASEQSIKQRRIVSRKEIVEELRRMIEKEGISVALNQDTITRFMRKFDVRSKITELLVKLGYLTERQRYQQLKQYKKLDKLQCQMMEAKLEDN